MEAAFKALAEPRRRQILMLVREAELRSSAWYSITDDEWPEVRRSLERRLGR